VLSQDKEENHQGASSLPIEATDEESAMENGWRGMHQLGMEMKMMEMEMKMMMEMDQRNASQYNSPLFCR